MTSLLDDGMWLPPVIVHGDNREYGGLILLPVDGNARALAVMVHGIAGDVGQSAYFSFIARKLMDCGVAVLLQRADGYIDHSLAKRVVNQGDPTIYVELLDRTLDSISRIDSRLGSVPLLLVPHSLSVAKVIMYGKSSSAQNRDRVMGMVVLSPVDVRAGFAKPSFVPAVAGFISRVGVGDVVVPASVLRRFGGADIDWGITLSSIGILGQSGGPLDVVHSTSDSRWLDDIDAHFPLVSGARHIYIGECDRRYGSTPEKRAVRIAALKELVGTKTDWPITVVDGANHSFQNEGAVRSDETQLLFDEHELVSVLQHVVEVIQTSAPGV